LSLNKNLSHLCIHGLFLYVHNQKPHNSSYNILISYNNSSYSEVYEKDSQQRKVYAKCNFTNLRITPKPALRYRLLNPFAKLEAIPLTL